MRLLLSMAGAVHGGAEVFFERLAMALARQDMPVHAAIRENEERSDRLTAAGIDVIQAPFGGPLDRRTRRRLEDEIVDFQPDAVISFMSRAAKFCPPARGRFVHVGRLGGYYDLKYYRSCHHLVGNTPDICRYIRDQGLAPDRVHYLPNFVDAAPAEPFSRRDFDTPPGVPVLAAMGRFHPNKAFDTLLRSLARVPDAHLWLAGEGPLAGELKGLAAELNILERVRLLGWTDEVGQLVESADMVVVPSRHEPLGNVVLEAWARGKPVVAAASQGPAQLIEDGVTGLLTAVDDDDDLAEALRRVLSDRGLALRLGEAGRQEYETTYSEAVVTQAYLDLLNRLCADKSRGTLRP